MSKDKAFAVLLVLVMAASLGGCIKRNLHISSDPAGATVYFNEREAGVTPFDYDFMWYAVHKVEVKKEGYETLEVLENIRPPYFCWPPFDLIFELVPYKFWDRKEVSYTLTPKTD